MKSKIFIFSMFLVLVLSSKVFAQGTYLIETNPNNSDQETAQADKQILNYDIETSFPNLSKNPFSLTISDSTIDFGPLSPTNPVIRTTFIFVSSQSSPDFIVLAQENHPLLSSGDLPAGRQDIIPDTVCDQGPCNETSSSEWANTLSYGLGYRCDNLVLSARLSGGSAAEGCAPGFNISSYYKQFADASAEEVPKIIMLGQNDEENKIQLTYKLNIPGSLYPGIYSNTIFYIAVPSY